MKIKISIFVCVLPLTLSVFPAPPFQPSGVNVIQSPFLLPQIPAPLFTIVEYGLYVWKIPMIENYVEFTEEYEMYLANHLSIYWSVKPELVISIGDPWYKINIPVHSNETYILLRIKVNKECEGFYWTGTNTGPAKRQLTARLLVRMMFDLKIQVPESKLIHLSREERNKESDLFLQIFQNNRNTTRIPRLFKIGGKKGHKIMEVPPLYSELDGSNVFVLDNMSTFIYIWNPNPNEENKERTKVARALVDRLKKVDKSLIKNQVAIIDGTHVSNDFPFQQIFLDSLYRPYGQPSENHFPTFSSSDTSEEWKRALKENFKLYEYSFNGHSVIQHEIHDRPLMKKHLKPDKAHVMTDSYTGTVFIHIGNSAQFVEIEQAMAAGELVYWKSSKHPWNKVTLIYQVDEPQHVNNLPTHFLISLINRKEYLKKYMTEV